MAGTTAFAYDFINGEPCSGSVNIDCSAVTVSGIIPRRIRNEETEQFETIEAFYIVSDRIEYGKIGMTPEEFTELCNANCCGDGGSSGIYDDQYNDVYA